MMSIDIDAKKRTSELISREAAIEAIGERPLSWNDTPEELQAIIDWDCYTAAIKSVPAVDAVPVVHGKKLSQSPVDPKSMICFKKCVCKCSVCGKYVATDWNYCSNCGAKMDQEDSDGQG